MKLSFTEAPRNALVRKRKKPRAVICSLNHRWVQQINTCSAGEAQIFNFELFMLADILLMPHSLYMWYKNIQPSVGHGKEFCRSGNMGICPFRNQAYDQFFTNAQMICPIFLGFLQAWATGHICLFMFVWALWLLHFYPNGHAHAHH